MGIISREDIHRIAESLSETGSSAPFLEMVHAIRDAPPAERAAVAAELGQVKRMEAKHGGLPVGMRISPRWFEDPQSATDRGPMTYGTPVVAFEDGCGAVSYGGILVLVREKDQ
jgi:hypothetical protein